MRVYKGFNPDMTCTCGSGTYKFEIGRQEITDKSKTRNSGFHASENPLECMHWYKYDEKNIICLCEAEEIDEENSDVMCAKKLTPVKKLGKLELAVAIMSYIYEHPLRECKYCDGYVHVGNEQTSADNISIARGKDPKAKTLYGGVIGLIKEENGIIESLKLKRIDNFHDVDRYFRIEKGEIVEAK